MTAQNKDGQPAAPGQGAPLIHDPHRVERAAGDLRRGVPVFITAPSKGGSVIAVAAETMRGETLTALIRQAGTEARLILSHARAATLKIPLYTPEIVSVHIPPEAGAESIRAIADPTTDLDNPLKGPFVTDRVGPPEGAAASLKLAKLAGLLPATLVFHPSDEIAAKLAQDAGLSQVRSHSIHAYEADTAKGLQLVTRARVPLRSAESCELVVFRPRDGGPEHYAIVIGAKSSPALATPGPVLTRLHSECFTGDLLASLKCDCGDQLRGAVAAIAASGGGILLYLAQEGRGIGMMNKMRAYRLQDEGFDTIEANMRLGFEPDERLYDIAARMLGLLGYRAVRLMTNNPEKIRALEAAGITVTERVPHRFPENVHNHAYLKAKSERGGHLS